jgi:hypothetical protein
MSGVTRLHRALIAAYPPAFRQRYGDELASLVADTGPRWRDTVDLLLGVGRAWMTPVFGGSEVEQRRARLQTTTVTVLAAWCASVLAAAGFSKAVDDPPLPGLRGVAGTAYNVGTVSVEVTAAAVLLAGFVFWLAVIVPALRAQRRDVAVPALAPALIVAAWLGITGLVALFAHHEVPRSGLALTWPRGAIALAVLLAWVVATAACVAGCAASAAVALRRARLEVAWLAASTVFAALVAAAIAAQAAVSVICLVTLTRVDGGLDPRSAVFATGSAVVVVAVTLMASVSATRGLRGLRSEPPAPLSPTT